MSLAAIHAYLRDVAALSRELVRVGPFLCTFTPTSDNPYLNYAIPDDGASPSDADVRGLIDAFEGHGRKPRLEYVGDLAPDVLPALTRHGFAVEGRVPLSLRPADKAVTGVTGVDGFAIRATTDVADLTRAVYEAFGSAATDEDISRTRDTLAQGGLAVEAREASTGTVAGGGTATPVVSATTEIALGVREAYRRRGIAEAVVNALVSAAKDAGATLVFLMSADPATQRIYERAGFVVAAEMVHASRDTARTG